jgi:hypothetical protein
MEEVLARTEPVRACEIAVWRALAGEGQRR